MKLDDIVRYSIPTDATPADNGEFVAYSYVCRLVLTYNAALDALLKTLHEEVNSRAAEIAKADARTVRAIQRAQVAERQVINAARALGYIDDGS